MRIEGIIRELERRVARHVKIADEAYCMAQYDTHKSAVYALRGAIVLIESYRTDNNED